MKFTELRIHIGHVSVMAMLVYSGKAKWDELIERMKVNPDWVYDILSEKGFLPFVKYQSHMTDTFATKDTNRYYGLLLMYSGANVSPGPSGGTKDDNANEISLSNLITSIVGFK